MIVTLPIIFMEDVHKKHFLRTLSLKADPTHPACQFRTPKMKICRENRIHRIGPLMCRVRGLLQPFINFHQQFTILSPIFFYDLQICSIAHKIWMLVCSDFCNKSMCMLRYSWQKWACCNFCDKNVLRLCNPLHIVWWYMYCVSFC